MKTQKITIGSRVRHKPTGAEFTVKGIVAGGYTKYYGGLLSEFELVEGNPKELGAPETSTRAADDDGVIWGS